jgi:hypothetical protein
MSGLAHSPEENEDLNSTPQSHSESTYQTPVDSNGSNVVVDPIEEQQHVMVLGAARSLKSMVNDWAVFLQRENSAEVILSGEVTIKLDGPDGRKEYTITLSNNDDDASKLEMSIEREPEYPGRAVNGMDTRKRSRHADNAENDHTGRKRARVDQSADKNADQTVDTGFSAASLFEGKLDNFSSQIRWVEDCRRTYDNHHHQREENWRDSTANFLNDTRAQREAHEQWMVHEMMWQHNALAHIMAELGNANNATAPPAGPVGPVMRWEVPAHLAAHPAPTIPLPGPTPLRQHKAAPYSPSPAAPPKHNAKPVDMPSSSKTTTTSEKTG